MRRLILVKHSLPIIDPSVPSPTWQLGVEGRRRCEPLSDLLRPFAPTFVVASTEPKAAETASLVAARLGLAPRLDDRLREHDRAAVGWLPPDAFEAAIVRLFESPDAVVFGNESARQAEQRFSAGVGSAIDSAAVASDKGAVVVVAHGTVISLYPARRAAVDPLPVWRRLGLPSFIVVSVPDFRLEHELATLPTEPASDDRESIR